MIFEEENEVYEGDADSQPQEVEEQPQSRGFGGDREMHSVTCAECGQQTDVPFKPDGTRPVYCRDCYRDRKPRRSGGGGFGGGRGGGGGFNRGPREMHTTTCAECGQEAEVPFKPDGSRPVYCRDCFSRQRDRSY